MIILVGSTREAKVEGVRDAVTTIARVEPRFGVGEIRAVDVSESAPAMPMTEAAIVDGARRRAAALLDRVMPSPDSLTGEWFVVGLEGGLDAVPGADAMPVLAVKTWACVSDGRRWSYGAGGAVVVPSAVARAVADGRELEDLIDDLAGPGTRGTRGAWGVLTRDLIGRREAFRLAVLAAFAPFYNPGLYE